MDIERKRENDLLNRRERWANRTPEQIEKDRKSREKYLANGGLEKKRLSSRLSISLLRKRRKIEDPKGYAKWKREESLKRHQMTSSEYQKLLDSQNGLCAICKVEIQGGRGLFVDHDHSCCKSGMTSCKKCNRGLLCLKCNVLIGMVGDSVSTLRSMLSYLENYK